MLLVDFQWVNLWTKCSPMSWTARPLARARPKSFSPMRLHEKWGVSVPLWQEKKGLPLSVFITYKRWLNKRRSGYRWKIIISLLFFLYKTNSSSPIWWIQKRNFCDLHGGLTVNKPSFKITLRWHIPFMLSKKNKAWVNIKKTHL